MRLAICGTSGQGKSTLVKAFLQRWNTFQTPKKTYRDIIVENGLEHSTSTNDETQLTILNWMTEEMEKFPKGSHVIYDRTTLDNLAYTLVGNADGIIQDDVAAITIPIVKESMKNLDIIFWLKYNPKIKIVDDGMRDTDIEYIKRVDSMFQGLYDQYADALENDLFFPKEDCCAIIPIEEDFLTVDDRLSWISEFVDYKGDLIETTKSILDTENLDDLEQMLKEQELQKGEDVKIKKLIDSIQKEDK